MAHQDVVTMVIVAHRVEVVVKDALVHVEETAHVHVQVIALPVAVGIL